MRSRFKTTIQAIVFLSFYVSVFGQSSFFMAGGAHGISLANNGTMFKGISSIYTNPAGLTSIEKGAFDVGVNRRYQLNELATVSIAGAKKVGSGVVGLSVSRYGYTAYSESKVGLSYGKQLFSNLSIGAGFHMLSYQIDRFGRSSAFSIDIGLQSIVNEKLSIGTYVFSPGTVSLTENNTIPTRFSMGLIYKASSKVDLYADVSKTIDRALVVAFAVDYHLMESFALRFGGNITKESVHFGPAYTFENGLTLVGGYVFDNRLGHTTGISLSYSI